MPKTPETYAAVVEQLIVKATPRKRLALDAMGHDGKANVRRSIESSMAHAMADLKAKRLEKYQYQRRKLVRYLSRRNKYNRKTADLFGVDRRIMMRILLENRGKMQ